MPLDNDHCQIVMGRLMPYKRLHRIKNLRFDLRCRAIACTMRNRLQPFKPELITAVARFRHPVGEQDADITGPKLDRLLLEGVRKRCPFRQPDGHPFRTKASIGRALLGSEWYGKVRERS